MRPIAVGSPFAPVVDTYYRRIGVRYHYVQYPVGVKCHILRNRKNLSRGARSLSIRSLQCPIFKISRIIRKAGLWKSIIPGCLNRFHGARCVTTVKRDGIIFALYLPSLPCAAYKPVLIPGRNIYHSIPWPGRPKLIKCELSKEDFFRILPMGMNLLKFPASSKCVRSHKNDAIRNINFRKGSTALKSRILYPFDRFGNMYRGKIYASLKCVTANIGHAFLYDYLFNLLLFVLPRAIRNASTSKIRHCTLT